MGRPENAAWKVIFPPLTMVMAACAPRDPDSIWRTAKIVAVRLCRHGKAVARVNSRRCRPPGPRSGAAGHVFVVGCGASAVNPISDPVLGSTRAGQNLREKNLLFSPGMSRASAVVGQTLYPARMPESMVIRGFTLFLERPSPGGDNHCGLGGTWSTGKCRPEPCTWRWNFAVVLVF